MKLKPPQLRKNPALMSCTPQSFLGAVLTAAQLGLEFGPMQQAYMVPFKNEITLIIGYKGWLKLIHNSAEIQSVSARTVFKRDEFPDYGYGLDEYLIHKPAKGERGAPVGYYAVIRKTNGGRSFAYMRHTTRWLPTANRYDKKRGGKLTGPWEVERVRDDGVEDLCSCARKCRCPPAPRPWRRRSTTAGRESDGLRHHLRCRGAWR